MTGVLHVCKELAWVPTVLQPVLSYNLFCFEDQKLSTKEIRDSPKGTQLVGAGGRAPTQPA